MYDQYGNHTGILELIDQLLGVIGVPLGQMGGFLSQIVTIEINNTNQVMPLSTAALTGFVMPFVNELGNLITAIANFIDAL